jgi:hypothetical protein
MEPGTEPGAFSSAKSRTCPAFGFVGTRGQPIDRRWVYRIRSVLRVWVEVMDKLNLGEILPEEKPRPGAPMCGVPHTHETQKRSKA